MIDDNSPIARNCDFPVAKRPLVQDVLEAVADHYRRHRLTVDELRGPSVIGRTARARQVACYVARSVTGQSYPQIARTLGRDHTTVLFAYRKIHRLRQQNDRLDALVRVITDCVTDPKPRGEG